MSKWTRQRRKQGNVQAILSMSLGEQEKHATLSPFSCRIQKRSRLRGPVLTSLLSATMISSTYLVVVWTWRLCCTKEGGEIGGKVTRRQGRMGEEEKGGNDEEEKKKGALGGDT